MKPAEVKTKRELINTIHVDPANFDHIGKHGKINGTLLIEIERILESYASQKAEVSKENICKFVKDYYNLPESGVQTLNIDSLIHCLETFSSQFSSQKPEIVVIPESIKIFNGNNEPCDVLFGPCCCGGWHDVHWLLDKLTKHIIKLQTNQEIPRPHIAKPEVAGWTVTFNENGIALATLPRSQLIECLRYIETSESKPQISEDAVEKLWYEYAINSYNDGSVIPNLTIMHMGYFQFLKAIESLSMPKTNVITEDEIEKAAKDYEDRTHEGPVSRWAINDFKAGAKWALSLSMPSDFAEFCEWCDEYLGYRAKDSDGDWSWFHFEGIFKNLAEVYDFWTREVKQTKS